MVSIATATRFELRGLIWRASKSKSKRRWKERRNKGKKPGTLGSWPSLSLGIRDTRSQREMATMLVPYRSKDDDPEWTINHVGDRLNDAPGLLGFEILEDPQQPRVRALEVRTADGGTFTLAFDARVAMALATALISAALSIAPTLKENFIEYVNEPEA